MGGKASNGSHVNEEYFSVEGTQVSSEEVDCQTQMFKSEYSVHEEEEEPWAALHNSVIKSL